MKGISSLRYLVFLMFIYFDLNAQERFLLNPTFKMIPTRDLYQGIEKNKTYEVIAVGTANFNGNLSNGIFVRNENGTINTLPYTKIEGFSYPKQNNTASLWQAHAFRSGVHLQLVEKGFQYDIRADLNSDAIEYVKALNDAGSLFNDAFIEDYLYTLANSMHPGVLPDGRPGNITIKILKSSEPNAFCLSNGTLVVSIGLLSTIQSEDELMGILAHEIAHFVLDHHLANYNHELDLQKRAAFWSSFATLAAAGADAILASKNSDYSFGAITTGVAITSTVFSEMVISKLGIKYSKEQEMQADKAALDILEILGYKKAALAASFQRLKNYSIKSGNYRALSGGNSHPDFDFRIDYSGGEQNLIEFEDLDFQKKMSAVNSFNARIEFDYFSRNLIANDLATKNISNGVGIESDYLVKAKVILRLYNSIEYNEQALEFIQKAKTLNVNPTIELYKVEALIHLRLSNPQEAKKAFNLYLTELNRYELSEFVQKEINWCKQMMYKADKI